MKWTLVDSHGLDVVPKLLANERDLHTRGKLLNSGYGFSQAPAWQAEHYTPASQLLHFSFYHFGGSAKWL